jgi:nicotinic acid mononucleotide adenylyltransferase
MSIDYNNNNTIIFTLARMNPPTPGHLFLIKCLIEEAIKKNVSQVYIILSKSNDDKDNPIPCPEKINVLGNADDITKTMISSLKEKMINEITDTQLKTKIQNIVVNTICVPEQKGATPFTPLIPIVNTMRDIPDINLFLIIGDDRKNMLDSITDFFFKWDNVHSISGEILPREEMSEFKEKSKDPAQLDKLVMSEVPVNAMSASFVRNIVKNKRRDKFTELYLPYLDEQKIPILYETILEGIETLPPNTKPDGPEKPLKYRYPMIKGVSEFPVKTAKKRGGKKTKRKYKKIRKTRKHKRSRRNVK